MAGAWQRAFGSARCAAPSCRKQLMATATPPLPRTKKVNGAMRCQHSSAEKRWKASNFPELPTGTSAATANTLSSTRSKIFVRLRIRRRTPWAPVRNLPENSSAVKNVNVQNFVKLFCNIRCYCIKISTQRDNLSNDKAV